VCSAIARFDSPPRARSPRRCPRASNARSPRRARIPLRASTPPCASSATAPPPPPLPPRTDASPTNHALSPRSVALPRPPWKSRLLHPRHQRCLPPSPSPRLLASSPNYNGAGSMERQPLRSRWKVRLRSARVHTSICPRPRVPASSGPSPILHPFMSVFAMRLAPSPPPPLIHLPSRLRPHRLPPLIRTGSSRLTCHGAIDTPHKARLHHGAEALDRARFSVTGARPLLRDGPLQARRSRRTSTP
jgi:hypothetical protein